MARNFPHGRGLEAIVMSYIMLTPTQYSRIRRLLVSLICILIGLVIMYACSGCGSSSQMTMRERYGLPEERETYLYVVEVMEPPNTGNLSVVLSYKTLEDVSESVNMAPWEGGSNSFVAPVPSSSEIRVSVWVQFDDGECRSPREQFYCGRVRMLSNNPLYSENWGREPTGKLEEVSVLFQAWMSDKPLKNRYYCDEEEMSEEIPEWTSRTCMYRPFDPYFNNF